MGLDIVINISNRGVGGEGGGLDGVEKFLICVLEAFKGFYKQPFSFCLAKFACFPYVSHRHGY